MPSLVTHYYFADDVYRRMSSVIGTSADERDAFFLGSQGPDPLFHARADIRIARFGRYGSTMHSECTDELLQALHESLDVLAPEERSIGRAYALGFLCHYLLDSTVHPLVYAQEFALLEAGVPGLVRHHGSEVHATIETDIDEVMLFTRTGQTIATLNPPRTMLPGSDYVLNIIGKMHSYIAVMAFGVSMESSIYRRALKLCRLTYRTLFYSPRGIKRSALGQLEKVVRDGRMFCLSMTMRPVPATMCDFDNHEHATWENPFTGQVSSDSFYNLYDIAQARADEVLKTFDGTFGPEIVHAITGGLNFSGNTRKGCLRAGELEPLPE